MRNNFPAKLKPAKNEGIKSFIISALKSDRNKFFDFSLSRIQAQEKKSSESDDKNREKGIKNRSNIINMDDRKKGEFPDEKQESLLRSESPPDDQPNNGTLISPKHIFNSTYSFSMRMLMIDACLSCKMPRFDRRNSKMPIAGSMSPPFETFQLLLLGWNCLCPSILRQLPSCLGTNDARDGNHRGRCTSCRDLHWPSRWDVGRQVQGASPPFSHLFVHLDRRISEYGYG